MVVIVIVSILASIGYPSYQNQIRATRRGDAQSDLLQLAGFMERFFTVNNRFDQDVAGNATALLFKQSPQDGAAKYYDIGFVAGQLTSTTYTLRATPILGTQQATDGYLELTESGIRRWDTNDNNVIDPSEDDWER